MLFLKKDQRNRYQQFTPSIIKISWLNINIQLSHKKNQKRKESEFSVTPKNLKNNWSIPVVKLNKEEGFTANQVLPAQSKLKCFKVQVTGDLLVSTGIRLEVISRPSPSRRLYFLGPTAGRRCNIPRWLRHWQSPWRDASSCSSSNGH